MSNTSSHAHTKKQQPIVILFFVFLSITTALFIALTLFILVPKIDTTFNSIQSEADRAAAQVYSGQLQQYIHDRELALRDIAGNPLVINAALLSDSESPAFRDFMSHITLLDEDPALTVINAIGEVLYTELAPANPYKWSHPLLTLKQSALFAIVPTASPQFDIAIPIKYGNKVQGILIARITGSPNSLFKNSEILGQKAGVIYQRDGQKISSDASSVSVKHEEEIHIDKYNIDFTYITDRLAVNQKKEAISHSFIITTLFGAGTMFILLSVFGQILIVAPFKALAESQQSIASAVEGISYIDVSGRYVRLNNAYANTAGYTPKELEGKEWITTVYPEDLPLLNEAYQTMVKTGKVTAEARGLRKDGSIFYKRVTMVSRYNKDGQLIGHDCFMQDISEQKTSDEALRKNQQDLQLIFDHVPVRIWYKDDKNRILRLNKQAAESMGGLVEDFEGKDTYDLFPSIAKKYHDDDLAVIHANKPKFNIIEQYKPLDSEHGWVSTNKIPYTDPITGASSIFVCALDITQLKNAESEKTALIEELSKTNQELEQFTYIASHDLKSPLRGINQLASWIQQDCVEILPETSKEHLSLMINRVHRMDRLLNDLLAYSHISRIELSEERIDLKTVLNNLLDLHVQPFGFTYAISVPATPILITREPFEIIIRNLLDNAVKHHHDTTGNIEIRYTNTEDSHIIQVADNGPGIPPHLQERAFQMFQTLQSRDKVEGSGIGLAIVKKILDRYNGNITVHSDGQAGTMFQILWPYKQDPSQT